IKQAVQITDQAYRSLFETVRPGTTEQDMFRHMAIEQLQYGADAPGSITIATHNAQNLQPSDRSHRRATSRALTPGDLAILDAGCVYRGYWSDYTRMFALGHTTDRCKHAYHTIYTCLQAALNAVKPGILARELVEVSNRVMLAAGYTEQAKRATGCGHASGLDIIEPPFLELASSAPLEAGMILTVEPSMVTDFGFFMLEEDILVTDTGYELLSEPVPEELPVL
ncbi:MAG: Xaa-Pro peptidase family protein, partial [bacterium]|nr:Xaa-Pro peptidase family protein [bacterium]